MVLVRYIALLITLTAGILFVIRKLKFAQNLAPFLVFSANTILLYVFSLTNILKLGVYIICLSNILLGIYAIIDWIRHKELKTKVFTSAIIAWVIIFTSLIFYNYGVLFSEWDEFSYWGPFFKYLMIMNHLPTDISLFSNINYPPFTGLLLYFFGQLSIAG